MSSWLIVVAANAVGLAQSDTDWPINGGVDNIRYSTSLRLNRDNVSDSLQVAWTYDSHDAFKGSEMQRTRLWSTACLRHDADVEVIAIDAAKRTRTVK